MRYPGTWFATAVAALLAAIAVTTTVSTTAAAQMGALPGGWHASHDSASDYHVGSDVSRRPGGTGMISGYIRATVEYPSRSAALTQTINADRFRGQRVRLTGFVRRSGNVGLVQLFLRVEGNGLKLVTDYIGATVFVPARDSDDGRGWIKKSIVVDVPAYSTGLRIGFVSMGADEAWLDDVRFELVGATVALTGSVIGSAVNLGTIKDIASNVKRQEPAQRKLAREFVNLDFESTAQPRR